MISPETSDPQRFSELFRRHYQDVYIYAQRRVRPDVAQDLVAETFLVAWRKLADVPEPALPWLYRVASYEIANARRRDARDGRLRLVLSNESAVWSNDAQISWTSEATDVARSFASLRGSDQEVLRLTAWEGLSAKECAFVLGCSVTAYRVRLHRARNRLARTVGHSGPSSHGDGADNVQNSNRGTDTGAEDPEPEEEFR